MGRASGNRAEVQAFAVTGVGMEFGADGIRVSTVVESSVLDPYYTQGALELQPSAEVDSDNGAAKACTEGC